VKYTIMETVFRNRTFYYKRSFIHAKIILPQNKFSTRGCYVFVYLHLHIYMSLFVYTPDHIYFLIFVHSRNYTYVEYLWLLKLILQCVLCFLGFVFYLLFFFFPCDRFNGNCISYCFLFLPKFVNFYLGQQKTKNQIRSKKTKCKKIDQK